jgi:hypothetical protein
MIVLSDCCADKGIRDRSVSYCHRRHLRTLAEKAWVLDICLGLGGPALKLTLPGPRSINDTSNEKAWAEEMLHGA